MVFVIYHEKQKDDALCGAHCLNNLVQDKIFNVGLLADIALELDEKEKHLMLSQGSNTVDAIKFLAQDSNRVDDSGNFNVDVLNFALQKRFNLTLVRDVETINKTLKKLQNENIASKSNERIAFVCNLHAHWIPIREMEDGNLYIINSLKQTPQKITKFHLSAYINQLRLENWSIFIVEGNLPPCEKDYQNVGKLEDWFIVQDADIQKDDFKAFTGSGQSLTNHTEGLDELEMAIKLSQQQAEKDEHKKAMELSLTEEQKIIRNEPESGEENIVNIGFVLPNGKRKKRKFYNDEINYALFQYAKTLISNRDFKLVYNGKPLNYTDMIANRMLVRIVED